MLSNKIKAFNFTDNIISSIDALSIFNSLCASNISLNIIIDDLPYNCSISKKTKMFSTIFDHTTHKFDNGFYLLTLE